MIFSELTHFAYINFIPQNESEGAGSPSVSAPGSRYMYAVKPIGQALKRQVLVGKGVKINLIIWALS